MPQVIMQLLFMGIKIGLVIATILAFTLIIGTAVSMITLSLNGSVIGDIFILIQMWLPFDINVILTWFTVTTIAYLTWRLAVMAQKYLDDVWVRF